MAVALLTFSVHSIDSMNQQSANLHHLRLLLCRFQEDLLWQVLSVREQESAHEFSAVADHTAADVLYGVDRIVEVFILHWFSDHWPSSEPVQLVMEGIPDEQPLCFPEDTPVSQTKWKLILDPIDGTRNLMVDKRSAWTLAGLAPQRGTANRLSDCRAAAMTQLPTSREWRADQLSAVRGSGLVAEALDVRTRARQQVRLTPSTATHCRHGFASITRFFPDGLGLLGQLEEDLWNQLYPEGAGASPLVFNDQYLTTGGQLYEIIAGRDRFIADLRPMAFHKLSLPASLAAHPYDLAAALLATESGVLLEDPLAAGPVDAPLDTTTPVAWVAFANQSLASHIRPALQNVIAHHLQPLPRSP